MIISYSVFSHTTAEDMLELIDHLFTYLKNNGKIYFTYCNIDNNFSVWRPNTELSLYERNPGVWYSRCNAGLIFNFIAF